MQIEENKMAGRGSPAIYGERKNGIRVFSGVTCLIEMHK
jgi:hypothetical protein